MRHRSSSAAAPAPRRAHRLRVRCLAPGGHGVMAGRHRVPESVTEGRQWAGRKRKPAGSLPVGLDKITAGRLLLAVNEAAANILAETPDVSIPKIGPGVNSRCPVGGGCLVGESPGARAQARIFPPLSPPTEPPEHDGGCRRPQQRSPCRARSTLRTRTGWRSTAELGGCRRVSIVSVAYGGPPGSRGKSRRG